MNITTMKKNAKRMKEIIQMRWDGKWNKGFPKWVGGAYAMYPHIPYEGVDNHFKNLIADLEKLENVDENEFLKLPEYLRNIGEYLANEVVEKTCYVCGKTYETFVIDNEEKYGLWWGYDYGTCSTACFNKGGRDPRPRVIR